MLRQCHLKHSWNFDLQQKVIQYKFKLNTTVVEVDFLWNRTVDSLKTSFHPLLWTSSDLRDCWKTTPYMGNGKLTDRAQNLQGCEKCNLRKAVGNLKMPYGCGITVIAQEGLKTCILAQEGLINSYIKWLMIKLC